MILEELQEFPIGAQASLERAAADGPVIQIARLSRQEGRLLYFSAAGRRWTGTPFPVGSRIVARVDVGESVLVAELDVVEVTPDGGIAAKEPSEIQRFTKRRYHRAAVDLPLTVKDVECRARDLSGCGLLALCPRTVRILKQDIVSASLQLDKGPPIKLRMYAVRTGASPDGGRLIGFDFLQIPERDQDRIIAYVLRQERRRLQAMRKL